MDIQRFDVAKHDLDAVARLIYLTDSDISSLLFGKDMKSALECIKKLMFFGQNTFSKDYIHVALSDSRVAGVLICFDGAQKRSMDENKAFGKVSCNTRKIVLFLLSGSLNRILTRNIGDDELYISNISVDPDMRGKGVGSALIMYAETLARKHGYRRMLLDVSTKNAGAYRLYERMGFEAYTKRSSLLFGRHSVTAMRRNV